MKASERERAKVGRGTSPHFRSRSGRPEQAAQRAGSFHFPSRSSSTRGYKSVLSTGQGRRPRGPGRCRGSSLGGCSGNRGAAASARTPNNRNEPWVSWSRVAGVDLQPKKKKKKKKKRKKKTKPRSVEHAQADQVPRFFFFFTARLGQGLPRGSRRACFRPVFS